MKYVIWILRIVLGLVFIFSGLVKANDPLGLTYKMQEIFEVWELNFMAPYAFWFSVLMIAFEIIAGFAMLVGNSFRLYITLMLWMNVFYTFLTGYILYSGKIKECGCFGDCFKISNTATFNKDIALTSINIILYIFRYRVFPIFNKASVNFTIVFIAALFSGGFQWWTLNHLPYHDCLPYKVGSNLLEKMKPAPDATDAVYESVLTYSKNGVNKDFPADKIPWQDKSWVYVSTKTKLIKEATGQPEIHDFVLTDFKDGDHTQEILSTKGYTLLWFLRDPEKANTKYLDRLHNIINKCKAGNVPFYVLASVGKDICQTYQDVWDMKDVNFLLIDGTVNKTAMRTNPGLMLLHDGVVEHKWSYLDYPKDIEIDNGRIIIK